MVTRHTIRVCFVLAVVVPLAALGRSTSTQRPPVATEAGISVYFSPRSASR